MGEGGVHDIVRQLTTTPAYQLFLAGVDVAAFLILDEHRIPERPQFLPYYFARRFGEMSGFIPSVMGGGRLFFVPDDRLREPEAALDELVRNWNSLPENDTRHWLLRKLHSVGLHLSFEAFWRSFYINVDFAGAARPDPAAVRRLTQSSMSSSSALASMTHRGR